MALSDLFGTFVGVRGQWFLAMHIDGFGDLLGAGSISQFVMEEKIGGDVPAFSMTFTTSRKGLVQHLNEGVDLMVAFGKDFEGASFRYALMTIQKFSNSITESELINITIAGLIKEGAEYLRENKQVGYEDKTSKEAIIDAANEHFDVVDYASNIEPDDKMNWLRPNATSSKFIEDTWKRSYVSDDDSLVYGLEFGGLATALSLDDPGRGVFKIATIKSLMEQDGGTPRWYLEQHGANETEPPNHASYFPEVSVNSDFGLMNNMITQTKRTPVHNIVEGTEGHVETPELKTVFVEGSLNLAKDGPKLVEHQVALVDPANVHENYNRSRLISVPRNSMVNSVELDVVIENKWQDYRLFDLIHYKPWRPHVESLFQDESKALGGIYVITRIARYYDTNRAFIKVTISRDGMNGMSGGNLLGGNLLGGILNALL